MKNLNYLKGFEDFTRKALNEAIKQSYGFDNWFSSQASGTPTDSEESEGQFYIAAEKPADLEAGPEVIETMKNIESSDADLADGQSVLSSNWNNAWEKRKALDSGKLTRKGDWYVGKGAWRINSNKASYLGMTPKWMQWEDSLQEDILQAFFPEVLKQDKVDNDQEEIDNVDLTQLGIDDELGMALDQELRSMDLELAPMESLKYIHRMFEAENFDLGPGKGKTEQEAVVLTPGDLIKRLVRNYNMQHRANVMIWGAPGIGKTQIVKQAAREIGQKLGKEIPVCIVTLSQMQPYDLNGIPLLFSKEGEKDFVMKADQKGKVQMDFAIPAWLPGPGDPEEGILFFDEINNADNVMLSASLSLLLDRKAQKYTMPPGWRVWAAGNRAVDSKQVTPLDGRVASRFLGGHFHLVPTVADWVKWTRSDNSYYQGIDGTSTGEWYIPDEFILSLEQMESSSADTTKSKGDLSDIPLYTDRAGNEIKTAFKYFYNFDKTGLMTGGEGVQVGFPTPRTWAMAFQNVYSAVLSEYKDRVDTSDTSMDPRSIGNAAFTEALNDPEGILDIKEELDPIVGKEATQSFMDFIKILAKYTDSGSTLKDKLNNIFKGKDPRPMVGGKKASGVDERKAILGLVEAHMNSMGKAMNSTNWVNWMKYLEDLGNNIDQGELASHIASVATHDNQEVAKSFVKVVSQAQQLKLSGKTEIPREDAAFALKFLGNFKDVLTSFNI